MPRSVHNVEPSEKGKGKKELKGVTKKKRAPPPRVQRTEAEKVQRKAELQRIKKRVIIDAQCKDATIPKATIHRIVRSCVNNWTGGVMKIQVKAIEMIRQHAEFVVNRAMQEAKKLMKESTRHQGVQVLDRHVNHVICTGDFYKKATAIPYALY